ncbi:type VI secretion system Vgr family protein [Cupriavidus sp. D384]|uniref:type VI secretion system Vgr family protein n=1 Tax=Cupriavidus sp. D384 TaxID=1538095 RepID=UPI00083729C6|nr:type VI secretion system Vgr family protein [Cupriavidus sp. D384]
MSALNNLASPAGGRPRTVSVSSAAIPDLLGQPQLEFVRLSGHEALSELFTYKVELRAVSPAAEQFLAEADPDEMIGREMTITIELDGMGTGLPGGIGAGHREITGVIAEVEYVGGVADNRLYRFTLRPWLWLATRTSDFKSFQKKTVIEILDEVLADYPFSVEKRLDTSVYPKLVWEVQHGETDAHFIQRLTEEYGITYFFEHDGGHHRLILASESGAYRKFTSEAYHTLPLYPRGFKIDQEHLIRFDPVNRLRTGKVTLNDYDHRKPRADLTTSNSQPRDTGFADLDRYEYPGDFTDPSVGATRARVRMEERRASGRRVRGVGALRGVAAGCTYMVSNHDNPAMNREYLVTGATLDLEDVGVESGSRQQFACQVAFEGHPTDEVFRPPLTVGKPRVAGLQRAIVTGPKNQEIWCNDHGNVIIQFEWDRYGKYDENSSPWIRVVNGWSGDQFGAMHIPRIGQEVIVAFLNGDPDCPLIVGRAPNQRNMPPWALPHQQALSGFRSREFADGKGKGGGRANKVIADDTPGQPQAQIGSDYRASELALGHIVDIPANAGRTDKRGEGFELRTDAWGALRASLGMLISTYERPSGDDYALSMGAVVDGLREGAREADQLIDAARTVEAHDGEPTDVSQVLAQQADAMKGEGRLKEMTSPHLVLTSPTGIIQTTPGSAHIRSGGHAALTAGQHISMTTGGGLFANVRKAWRVFVYEAGIRLMAASGDIDIRALKDSINLLAKLKITLKGKRIEISAEEELRLAGGGSAIVLNGDINEYTPGGHTIHAARKAKSVPRSMPVEFETKSVCVECLLKAAKSNAALLMR